MLLYTDMTGKTKNFFGNGFLKPGYKSQREYHHRNAENRCQ
jgi:hypothetical protein